MFTLVCIATGEFDSDWHTSYEAANMHRVRCFGADAGAWYVAQLSEEQVAQIYSV